jgi:hypothetical protein
MTLPKPTLLALALAASPALALAQDDSLYPDPASPDASFLRVIAPQADAVTVAGTELAPDGTGVTPYAEVAPGAVEIDLAGQTESIELGANTHYTYLAGAGEPVLIEDAVEDSPAQADLLIYNLSDHAALDVFAVEADTEALSDVAPDSHAGVGLKAPMTLTFEIREDGETLAALDPVDLRRGTATTIVVTGGEGDVEAGSTTSTYQ